ncbi:short chain dehydrogenase reductase [Grosmannia clavigera kw1407]|uniref:Short chain dehydrogenase reductase n=1 Tax=Grosmannia clavigera (strain kw1407 / UAMH 11150) TaxID=655863 RepID=F0XE38_GROCL|nr:short chain dehydrogenase reductase [Grosmannia clavigera kw1407]EFX04042.1 short chain dehydrogenase reductase [Grosmannia clavigera kw1407]
MIALKATHSNTYAAIAPTLPQLSTAGKSAFVTGGGARGIGAAIASSLVRSGITSIGLLGRQEDKLRESEAALRVLSPTVDIHVYAGVDVRDIAAVKKAVTDFAASAKGSIPGKIDILVTNAGYMPQQLKDLQAYQSEVDRADWWSVFEINVLGNFNVVQAFQPVAAPGASVVHISSMVADMPYVPTNGVYSASKVAATKLFEYVHNENPDLFVVQVHPGLILTTDMAESFRDAVQGYTGIDVELPGDFVNWVVSPEARFLNGRFVDAEWDIDELKAHESELKKDLRKYTVGILGLEY